MAAKPLHELVAQHIYNVTETLVGPTCPIYQPGKRGQPDLVGSATLLRVRRSNFLLTAAHVMDYARSTELYVGLGTTIAGLTGRFFSTKAEGPNGRKDDMLDLTVCFLESPEADSLDRGDYVTLDQLYTVPVEPESHTHVVIGYPASKQPRILVGDVFNAVPLRLATHLLDADEHRNAGYDPIFSMLLEFDKEQTWKATGLGTATDPHGVSGGGVWSVPDLLTSKSPAPSLAGIAIEWHRANKRVLASRVQVCLALIDREYPELRTDLAVKLQ